MMSKKMTEKDTEDEIKSAFKAFDTNNSGAITGMLFLNLLVTNVFYKGKMDFLCSIRDYYCVYFPHFVVLPGSFQFHIKLNQFCWEIYGSNLDKENSGNASTPVLHEKSGNASAMCDRAVRARPLMIWGGGRRKSRKKISKALLQEKKKASARKKNSRQIFSPPPQIINGRALRDAWLTASICEP